MAELKSKIWLANTKILAYRELKSAAKSLIWLTVISIVAPIAVILAFQSGDEMISMAGALIGALSAIFFLIYTVGLLSGFYRYAKLQEQYYHEKGLIEQEQEKSKSL